MSDSVIYCLLGILLLVIWVLFFALRSDLRRIMLRASIVGGAAGLLSEFWYLRDYWQPPTVLGYVGPSIEDVLFGFTITGIAVSIYDVVTGKREQKSLPRRIAFGITAFIAGLASLVAFSTYAGYNSILVSSFAFILIAGLIWMLRVDLCVPSFITGILCALLIIPIYAVLFNILSPAYWDNYWLLHGTALGKTILGNIPLTELLWYFSWGCLASALAPFVQGRERI